MGDAPSTEFRHAWWHVLERLPADLLPPAGNEPLPSSKSYTIVRGSNAVEVQLAREAIKVKRPGIPRSFAWGVRGGPAKLWETIAAEIGWHNELADPPVLSQMPASLGRRRGSVLALVL